MTDLIETRSKKVRGMAQASLDMIHEMRKIAAECQPITGRGIGYKLFSAGLIPGMGKKHLKHMQRVYRLLKQARERGMIPWPWIVDETRELERSPSWNDPAAFVRTVRNAYRRDFWDQQPARVEVWSEKGTIRGVLAPVLEEYGVGFRATPIYDVAQDYDGRPLVVLYVGDFDPSGMFMSEEDLPKRIARYGGDHVVFRRIALLREDIDRLPTFLASEKRKDTRYAWFVRSFGTRCCELDALDPGDLRARVEMAIQAQIEPAAWDRCKKVNAAEQASLRTVLDSWRASA